MLVSRFYYLIFSRMYVLKAWSRAKIPLMLLRTARFTKIGLTSTLRIPRRKFNILPVSFFSQFEKKDLYSLNFGFLLPILPILFVQKSKTYLSQRAENLTLPQAIELERFSSLYFFQLTDQDACRRIILMQKASLKCKCFYPIIY